MNNAKLQTAANIILNTLLETLATVHGCTVAQVSEGLRAGNVKLMAQFKQLAERGATEATELHRAGKISLV